MKKILSVLLSVLMLMMSMAVYATEAEHVHEGCCGEVEVAAVVPETPIVPMVEYCSNCGTGRIKTRSDTKTVTRNYMCEHYGETSGRDYYRETQYYTVYYCSNNCGSGEVWKYVDSSLAFISCSNGHIIAPGV